MGWIDLVLHAADSALRSVMGMTPKFILRRNGVAPTPRVHNAQKLKSPKAVLPEIVKSRPASFEERYAVTQSARAADDVFVGLRKVLFEDCDEASAKVRRGEVGCMIHREVGKTSEGRPFMFFKPFSDYGWLIERSGAGWRVSRAEKIVSQKMFLRSSADPWDVVLVYEDPKGEGSVRIKSQRFGSALLSLAVYQLRMREAFLNEVRGRVH